jgi:hypothetical protein
MVLQEGYSRVHTRRKIVWNHGASSGPIQEPMLAHNGQMGGGLLLEGNHGHAQATVKHLGSRSSR